MKLYIDLGNTMLKCGIDDGDSIKLLFRIPTKQIDNDFINELNKYFSNNEIESVNISSVVPEQVKRLVGLLKNVPTNVISPLDNAGVKITIDNPKELGTDLLCDLAGARAKYGVDLLIIDLGTANKFLYLNEKGEFNSCAITLGLGMSLKKMSSSTALLPDIDISSPKKLLDCHNTIDVLNASAYYSQIAIINNITKQYKEEIGHDVRVILTGGNADIFKDKLNFEFILEEYLCLYGLKIITTLKE